MLNQVPDQSTESEAAYESIQWPEMGALVDNVRNGNTLRRHLANCGQLRSIVLPKIYD